jgi:DNA processing protein
MTAGAPRPGAPRPGAPGAGAGDPHAGFPGFPGFPGAGDPPRGLPVPGVSLPAAAGRGAPDDERFARAVLGRLAEPGRLDLWQLVHEVGAVEALQRVRAGAVPARLRDLVAPRLAASDVAVETAAGLDRCARLGGRLVVPGDDEWPEQALHALVLLAARRVQDRAIGQVWDVAPPLALWARGPRPVVEAVARSVAVVGARAATGYGAYVAAELGYGLADRGWAVVSGGAYGIDAAAHRGALAAEGCTVAVLACGVDTAYPVGNTNLFEEITEKGLLLSEWPPGTSPRRQRFLVRNRVIAALSAGTVVVEAAARSGALATARRAHDLGRALMAVPGPITSALSVGAHQIVRERDARLVTSAAEVVEEVGLLGADLAARPQVPESWRDALGREADTVLDVLGRRSMTVEEVAAEAGIAVADARRILPALVDCALAARAGEGYRAASEAVGAQPREERTVLPPVR